MLSLYVYLLLSSYVLLSVTTNATEQKIIYISNQVCLIGNGSASYDTYTAREDDLRLETAACEFPRITYRTITNNYALYLNSVISDRITIEFNETITRNDTANPLKYVIESDGVVKSQKFNGYHAKQILIVSSNAPSNCDANGVFTQSLYGPVRLTLFKPELLSEQNMNEIRANFVYTNDYPEFNYSSFLLNTLNKTGAICFGDSYHGYAPNI